MYKYISLSRIFNQDEKNNEMCGKCELIGDTLEIGMFLGYT